MCRYHFNPRFSSRNTPSSILSLFGSRIYLRIQCASFCIFFFFLSFTLFLGCMRSRYAQDSENTVGDDASHFFNFLPNDCDTPFFTVLQNTCKNWSRVKGLGFLGRPLDFDSCAIQDVQCRRPAKNVVVTLFWRERHWSVNKAPDFYGNLAIRAS